MATGKQLKAAILARRAAKGPRKKRTRPKPRQYTVADLERARDRVAAAEPGLVKHALFIMTSPNADPRSAMGFWMMRMLWAEGGFQPVLRLTAAAWSLPRRR